MEAEEFGYNRGTEVSSQQKKTYAVIDGLNVAFARNDGVARLSDLVAISKHISNEYDKFDIIADASARHKIADQIGFDSFVKRGKIQLCPAGIDADDLIWMRVKSLCKKGYQVSIVSNDMFPVSRSKKEGICVASVVVSIFHDGDIYFITRNINRYPIVKAPLTGGEVHLVELQS